MNSPFLCVFDDDHVIRYTVVFQLVYELLMISGNYEF